MTLRTIRSLGAGLALAPLLLAFALSGCTGKTADEPAPVEKAQAPAGDAPSAAVLAALMKADSFDGATDKVISKCATCSLAMEGSADHAVSVGEYKVHLCSADCQTKFEEDPTKAILAMKIPEVKAPTTK